MDQGSFSLRACLLLKCPLLTMALSLSHAVHTTGEGDRYATSHALLSILQGGCQEKQRGFTSIDGAFDPGHDYAPYICLHRNGLMGRSNRSWHTGRRNHTVVRPKQLQYVLGESKAALIKSSRAGTRRLTSSAFVFQEGLVTMFQVLVVNDWHAIAEVFVHATRCSSPKIVYPFFITGNLIGVSILLNLITAFFVECKCWLAFFVLRY